MATIKPVRFEDDPNKPLLARAAALGLAVLRHCKALTWSDFERDLDMIEGLDATGEIEVDSRLKEVIKALAALDLTEEERLLLARFRPVLNLLTVRPLVTVAVCPECGGWILVSTKTPSGCTMSAGCAGKPVKASIATRIKEPTVPDGSAPDETSADEEPPVKVGLRASVEFATAAP